MNNIASRWKIVQIIISVHRMARGTKDVKNWKTPFKRLKLSTIRAEDEWRILLDVNEKEVKKIYKLTDGRFHVETVMEEVKEFVSWEDKTAQLGQNVDIKV